MMPNKAVEKAARKFFPGYPFTGSHCSWEEVLATCEELYQQGKEDGVRERLDELAKDRQSKP